jgi:hypothetical protein
MSELLEIKILKPFIRHISRTKKNQLPPDKIVFN